MYNGYKLPRGFPQLKVFPLLFYNDRQVSTECSITCGGIFSASLNLEIFKSSIITSMFFRFIHDSITLRPLSSKVNPPLFRRCTFPGAFWNLPLLRLQSFSIPSSSIFPRAVASWTSALFLATPPLRGTLSFCCTFLLAVSEIYHQQDPSIFTFLLHSSHHLSPQSFLQASLCTICSWS